MHKLLLPVYLLFFITPFAFTQNYSDSLSLALDKIANQSDLPGFAVSIVSQEEILYKRGFGYSKLENKTPFTDQSVQNIGSITKTLIAFALMKLVEEDKVKLDDPINRYLPFEVHNPYFPDTPITIRQLATHTSSLTDGEDDMIIEKSYLFTGNIDFKKEELPEDYFPYFQIYQTNQPMLMGQFLQNTYSPDGEWYAKSNFLETPPGTQYQYTNLGATLLAYLIEKVAGQKFSDFTKKELLEPLKMTNSYWTLDKIPAEKQSALYMSNGLAIPGYSLITYPDGGLFTNVADFSLYIIEMLKGLNGKGTLLRTESYKEMMSNQLTDEHFPASEFKKSKGLMWFVNKEGDNITMNGGDPGVVTYTLFTTAGNVGIIFFTNKSFYGNESLDEDFQKIRATLFKYVGKLMKK